MPRGVVVPKVTSSTRASGVAAGEGNEGQDNDVQEDAMDSSIIEEGDDQHGEASAARGPGTDYANADDNVREWAAVDVEGGRGDDADSDAFERDTSNAQAGVASVWTAGDGEADGAADESNAELQEAARTAAARAAEESPMLTEAEVEQAVLQRPKAMTVKFDMDHVRRRSAEADAAAADMAAGGRR